MLKILAVTAAVAALSFGGCAQVETFLNSPAQQTAIVTAADVAACVISSGAAVALGLEPSNGVGQSGIGTTTKIVTDSSATCTALGGLATTLSKNAVASAAVVTAAQAAAIAPAAAK